MNNKPKAFKQDYNVLSKSEYAGIIFGSIVGLFVLEVPKVLGKIAYQDNWITAAVGSIYPFYMVIISIYLSKKCPEDNILNLSKKYFGSIFGGVLNFIFLFYFFILLLTSVNDYSHMMKAFVVDFLTPVEIVGVVMLVSGYVASKGIKAIGRICKITFFLTIILVMSPIPALRAGRIINIYPMLQSGYVAILKGAIDAIPAYSGLEVVFLIYPMLNEKDKYIKSSILPVFLTCIVYMWACFISVYYLGTDVTIGSKWPLLLVTESVTVTVINNFKSVFIFIWSLIIFKSIAIFYYSSAYIGNNLINKLDIKKIIFLIYPVAGFICIKYGWNLNITNYVSIIIKFYEIFNILYVTVISIIIYIYTNRQT